MTDQKQTDRELLETLYQMVNEVFTVNRTQHGGMINALANVQKTLQEVVSSVSVLAAGLADRHEVRLHEEIAEREADIDNLKMKIRVMEKLNEEKKVKSSNGNKTSQDIEKIAMNVLTQAQQAEIQKKQIDWIKIRDMVIGAVVLWLIMERILPLLIGK